MKLIQQWHAVRDRFRSPHKIRTTAAPLTVGAGRIMQQGQPVRLSGMSLFWTNLQPNLFDTATVQWLADDWQIDILRVPIGIAPEGGPMSLSQAALVAKKAIDAAIKENLYVLIDWHVHDAPAEAAPWLASLAEHYGDLPNILYEPWNEPDPQYDWSVIRHHHERVIEQVRRHAPSALIVAGTPDHCQRLDLAAVAQIEKPNIAYALHFYAGTHRDGLRARARLAADAGIAMFASEWGVSEANGDGVIDWPETERWLTFLAEHTIGDVAWAVSAKPEACAVLTPRASIAGWSHWALTPAGRFHRARLRKLASMPYAQSIP